MLLFALVVGAVGIVAIGVATSAITWPFSEPGIRFEAVGPSVSDAVPLDGEYIVSWSAAPTSPSACQLEASLLTSAGRFPAAHLVSMPIEGGKDTTGSGRFTVPADQYVVVVRSGCRWSLRLSRP
jgi:hypothetical protein